MDFILFKNWSYNKYSISGRFAESFMEHCMDVPQKKGYDRSRNPFFQIMEITYESIPIENHQKKNKAAGVETLYHPVRNHFFPAGSCP